ncbi:MAG: hypothetical protein WAT71_06150 [Ignavibacteria bacterium]
MDLEKLKTIWDNYDEKLDETLEINRDLIKSLKMEKVRSKLKKFIIYRSLELLFTIFMISLLWDFAVSRIHEIQFVLPAVILSIFFIIGIAGIVRQFVTIGMMDLSGPVIEIQKDLILLKTHILQVIRISILSVPFYMAYLIIGFEFFFNIDIINQFDELWLAANLIFSLLLVPVSIWLFLKLSYKNFNTRFVKKLLSFFSDVQIINSLNLIEEIREFERN